MKIIKTEGDESAGDEDWEVGRFFYGAGDGIFPLGGWPFVLCLVDFGRLSCMFARFGEN